MRQSRFDEPRIAREGFAPFGDGCRDRRRRGALPVTGVQAPVSLEACWIADGRLLAGAHPAAGPTGVKERIDVLLDAGVRQFVDITTPEELPGYERSLRQLADARDTTVTYARLPIPPRSVSITAIELAARVKAVLAELYVGLGRGAVTYLHGNDPMRRTGMVIGCYLVSRGQDSRVALDWLETRCWRNGGRLETRPLTTAQKAFVNFWGDRIAA